MDHPTENTHWHVISGAPCAGKTAVIDQLSLRGHRVVHEVARAYIDQRLTEGATLEEIKADPLAFERHILFEKLRIEARLPKEDHIFLDRAAPDSIAYYEIEGLDPTEAIEHSRRFRYQTVFMLERLPYEKDKVRSETDTSAIRIASLLERGYTDLGYTIVHVPVMAIAHRVDFVLAHLGIG